MARIRCLYEDCVYLKKGICSAPMIELDPEDGCLTYSEEIGGLNDPFLEEDEGGIDDSWEDEGFEELDELDFEDDDY